MVLADDTDRTLARNRHPSGAPVLSRPRSPSRALAALASLRDALRAPWTAIILGSVWRLLGGWLELRTLRSSRYFENQSKGPRDLRRLALPTSLRLARQRP